MSEIVVINGPDATAGSILNLSIIKGITAPNVVEMIKANQIDAEVTIA